MATIREALADRRMPYSIGALNMTKEVNIGGLIRGANAFLMREVIYIGEHDYPQYAAVGADQLETVHHFPTTAAFLAWLETTGRPLVCIEQTPTSVALQEADIPEGAILMLGQELFGTPPELVERAALCVEIPQFGRVGSLNVVMAGTVVMYELASRYHFGRERFRLPEGHSFKPGGKPKRHGE